ncbi:MAG TPA: peptidylprolyl isomerase [Actinomycetota bacterium]|nr:peptidylprolyl isomerase [Actinomycetota bacterium]
MKASVIVRIVALAAIAAVGCGKVVDTAAARVGGTTISVNDVTDALEEFETSPQYEQLSQQGDAAALRRTYEQNFLAQEIRRRVLAPEADERGIEVTEADVEERLDQIKADFPNESAFQEALAEQGYDMETLRVLLRDSLLEERLRAVVVEGLGPSEAELRRRYESETERFTEYRVAHILVTDNARAVEISGRLEKAPPGKVDDLFAKLAKKFSKDPGSADAGGNLGWSSTEAYVEPFAKAVEDLEPGEISKPVRTEFGFHVIRLEDERLVPFERVSEQLRAEVAGTAEDDAWTEFVVAAYENAGVEVNPRYGVLDPESGQIRDADPASRPGAATPVRPRPSPTDIPEPAG